MLTDIKIRAARPRDKPYKVSDERGLYLLVTPSGGRWWRFKFRIEGREKVLALGTYPDISLKDARDRREDARKALRNGIDPAARRRAEKSATGDSFEAVAREWFGKFAHKWAASHSSKLLRRLELYVFPWIGSRPIQKIESSELLACLRRIEDKGNHETAHRALQVCSRVFRYAAATSRVSHDPASLLRGALTPAVTHHLPAITDPRQFAALLRAMDSYEGSIVVRCALKLAPLVFLRPGELRGVRWDEIDFEAEELRIRPERMKMKTQHVVPLARQAVEILNDIKPLTGDTDFVFPSARSSKRPLSDNALLAALRRMGFEQGSVTIHGLRTTASTTLNEQGWNRDAIERQLAHGELNAVRGAYNRAEFLAERRRMMQHWADHCDSLRLGNNVISIGHRVSA